MRITSKGQVTIPQALRERFGFLPGTEVEFLAEGGTLRVVRKKKSRAQVDRLVEDMRGRGTVPRTTDEILALTRS